VEIARVVWDALIGVGTTLTLTVIVMIALAINALALFYVSSAVVVLERFARTVRRVRWVLFFGVVVALGAAYLSFEVGNEYELAGAGSPLSLVAAVLAGTAALTAVSIGICWLALRSLSSARLGTAALIVMGVAAALMLGGTGRVLFALAPSLSVAVVLGAVVLRRRLKKGAGAGRGFAETQLGWLALVLAMAPILAVILPEPDLDLAAAGGGLLQLVWLLIVLGLVPLAAAGLVEMRHSAEWFVAIRYLVAQRRQVYIGAITLLCIGGIAAGVWLIVTVLSVMNGFERAWREQIVGDLAHFTVHSGLGRISEYQPILDMVRQVPDVEAASPYLDAEGMVRSASGRLFGVRLRGVDPETADTVTDVSSRIENGSLAMLGHTRASDGARRVSPIIIGKPLAEKLDVSVGEDLVLISPLGGPPTPLGPAPRLKKFRVAGVYQSRLHQFGEVYTYVNLADAQDFARAVNVIDGIEARTPDLYTSRRVAEAVRAKLDSPYYTRDWKDHFPVFFAALRDNRSMMILLLGMIMVVAAFMIVATLMMMIMEKSSDIAILKAMGAEDATIERIFAIEGTLIGLAGTGLGVLAGLAVTSRLGWIQSTIEAATGIDTLPADIYQLSTLPADHDPVQLVGIVAMAMVLSLGATLVPARQGARFDPVEGLRSE
jgi:lipoprotein-releasing system permease protein